MLNLNHRNSKSFTTTTDSSSGGDSTATTLLSGTVQTSTASTAPLSNGGIAFNGQSSSINYAEVGANCTVQALDAKTEEVIVTTTSHANGNYEFTDDQIAENTAYKILTICDNKKCRATYPQVRWKLPKT